MATLSGEPVLHCYCFSVWLYSADVYVDKHEVYARGHDFVAVAVLVGRLHHWLRANIVNARKYIEKRHHTYQCVST